MPGAEDIQQRGRKHRLDEDLQRAAADQARVVLGIVVEVEGERARLFFFHDLARRLPDLGLHAAAADRPCDGAVVAHQHLRSLERRDGAANVGDGSDGAAAAFAAQLDDLFVDVHGGGRFHYFDESRQSQRLKEWQRVSFRVADYPLGIAYEKDSDTNRSNFLAEAL